MKQYSTNYYNTFITIADDTKANHGIMPPVKPDKQTVANYQFDLIGRNPLRYTSDDILFMVYAVRGDIPEQDYESARLQFYSKGQPCLRTSPLAKTYGWGIYSDDQGRVKLVDSASEEYEQLLQDENIKKVAAMRSQR
ncbi:hypothetical protein G5B30_12495 [Sphingobacterium sp. SGG-5]|uniref:DUF6157 family protein n=1 Tax=Sphingobacterium sp. SGG-5 TaxID=2710881 RepID=UPI0013ECBCE7|nr:DUF6157 family protein [Sphingobacterium sp. SGG-5]NGM62733.1 hypothetical protein [Sphingobacterium sp. SGG-5]